MRIHARRLVVCVVAAACETAPSSRHPINNPAVALSASQTSVHWLDSVTFVARIRSDIAARLRPMDHPGDATDGTPHVVGWRWIPDIDIIDPWTKACESRDSTCTVEIHGSGTMVFSIRLSDQVCADWIHIDALSLPDIGEVDDPGSGRRRLRADSVSVSIRTKAPYWERCTA